MKNLLAFVFLTALAASACAATPPVVTNPLVVVDALNREVQFETLPERIVIAGRQTPMLVNFVYLFETAGSKIAAIERRNQSAENFLSILDPDIELKFNLERDAGVEQIAPLDPDVVILKTTMRESVGLRLEEVGIPVIYIDFESIEQIYRDLRIFAALLGEKDRGEELVSEYQQIKSAIDDQIGQSSITPDVVLTQVEDQDGEQALSVPSAVWLQTALIEELGADPLWVEAAKSGGWTTVNIEQILNWDPGYIFVINYQGNGLSIVENMANDTLWQNMEAFNENQAFAFGYDFLSWDQPDPRWILGYSWLASRLYPDLVSSEQALDVVRSFYADFYGLTGDDYNEFVAPRISGYFD